MQHFLVLVVRKLMQQQARNQGFFRTGEVSEIKSTSINI